MPVTLPRHISGDVNPLTKYTSDSLSAPLVVSVRMTLPYTCSNDPFAGPKHIERIHPMVRVHPATGWKALWVNRAFTKKIVDLDQAESDLILGYLFDVFEKVL